MITAEYLPTDLNVDADRESRNVMDWSEWKLHPWLFEQICLTYGTPEVDLFASRTSHQIHDTRSLFILYSGFLMFLLNGSRQYIQLSAWAVSGRREQAARCRRELDTCWSTRENWQPDVVTTQPGRKLVAGGVRGKLILFSAVQYILEFLASLYQEGSCYSAIGNARSAISAYHDLIGGRPVGEHTEVSKLMKGASNLRPVCPKYCSTWDVDQVLRLVISLGVTRRWRSWTYVRRLFSS